MRTSMTRALGLTGLVILTLLAGYRTAILAQSEPARSATPHFAPGMGGGFGRNENKPAAKPLATIYLTTPMTAAAAKTWMKLQEPISLPFANETPLEDALKFIKDATKGKDDRGIPYYVDPIG